MNLALGPGRAVRMVRDHEGRASVLMGSGHVDCGQDWLHGPDASGGSEEGGSPSRAARCRALRKAAAAPTAAMRAVAASVPTPENGHQYVLALDQEPSIASSRLRRAFGNKSPSSSRMARD